MNRFLKFLSCAIMLMMALSIVPGGMLVSADETNEFGDGSQSKTITFDGKGTNNETTIKLPYEAEASEAVLTVEAGDNGGEYLYNPSLSIENGNNNMLWQYSGSGFGHFGKQTVFNDNETAGNLSFGGNQELSTRLLLPKNATVTSATMDITGAKSAGTMSIPESLSGGSLITSMGAFPDIAIEGENIYSIWIDSGDLDYAGTDQDIFFKRSTDSGTTWDDAFRLSDSDDNSYSPTLAVDGDNVYAAWTESPPLGISTLHFRRSTDGGENWEAIERVEGNFTSGSIPIASGSGGYSYLVWNYNGQIEFARKTGSGKWETQTISGSSGSDERYAQDPWIASYGNDVYVSWIEQDQEDGTNYVMYKHSSKNGEEFPETPTEIYSENVGMRYTRLASNENGHIYVIWLNSESINRVYNLLYSYSTNSGSSWSEPIEIDGTDQDVYEITLSSERESGVNYVYAAWYGQDRNISFSRSTNEVTWSLPQMVVEEIGSDPYVGANDDGHVYLAYTIQNNTNGLHNQDVYIKVSEDRGTNWDEGTLLSRELFDGDSMKPEMVTVGEDIYVVWQEQGNITGIENGIEGDIFFRHFDGNSWSDIQVISDDDLDLMSQNPHIAVSGQNIYVVWQDYEPNDNTDDVDNDIMARHSSNGGTTWGQIYMVSDDANDGESWVPRVAASGSTGHVVWRESGDVSGSGMDTDICYRRIGPTGPQGSTTVISDDPNDGYSYEPDIAMDGNNIYVVWYDDGDFDGGGNLDYDIVFEKSTNSGTSWGSTVVISQTTTYSYDPVIAVGDYIYVVWEEGSYPTFSRSLTGDEGTWSQQERIDSQYSYDLSIDAVDENIAVSFEYSSVVYLTGSYSAGDSWEDSVKVSTDDSEFAGYPTVGIGEDEVHLCYEDSGNVSGTGYDYDILYRHSVDSYPSNVELDVGNDGTIDWQHPGELSTTETYDNSDGFHTVLNTALETADYYTDIYGNQIATIVFRVTSDTAGLVTLDNMGLEYDYEVEIHDFTKPLNDYIEDHQDDRDDDGNVHVPLVLETGSAGQITLKDLFIEYELTKVILITSPEDQGQYTESIDIEWEAKNFEGGDQVTISYYDGHDWNELDTVDANDGSWPGWDTSEENGRYYKVRIEYVDDSEVFDETGFFMIDNHPPTTTHTYDYTGQYTDGESTVWGSEVEITLNSHDDFDGGDRGSGVNITNYSVNGGEFMEYLGPFTIQEHGINTFDYYSVDEMGNQETTKSGVAHVDAIEPEVQNWDVPELRYNSAFPTHVSVQVSDEDTGIDPDSFDTKFQYALGDDVAQTSHQNWRNVENEDFADGTYSGDIDEDWPAHTENWGTFYLYLRCSIADNVGNVNVTEVFEIVEPDIFPPNIIEIGSEVDDDNDNTYFIGDEVKLFVVTDEEGITGSVRIAGGAPGTRGTFDTDLQADGTTYWALWDTTGLIPKPYDVVFTLTDDKENAVDNGSLKISIEQQPYPELSVTSISFAQHGKDVDVFNGEAIENGVPVQVSVLTRNSGTLAVTEVDLSIYEGEVQASKRIATELVDIEAFGTKVVNLTWTPSITLDTKKIEIIAVIDSLDDETTFENNKHSEDVDVDKLPDFTITSIIVKDLNQKTISSARTGDKITFEAIIENIGDANSITTVTGSYGGVKFATDPTVNVHSGSTTTVNLEWASAAEGMQTITIKIDPANSEKEKNENNNEMTIQFEVKKSSGGGGGTESDEGMPTYIPILMAVIIIAGVGGAFFFYKSKQEEDEWSDDPGSADTGWDDAPAAGAAAAAAPKPRPKPIHKPTPKPAPKEKAAGAGAGEAEEKPAAVAAVKVKCPKCTTILSIKTPQRPVTVKCPKCETKLTIKE